MGAVRRFDHDECRARRAAGESVRALAAAYGVSVSAIYFVVSPQMLAKHRAYHAAWQMSGTCHDCGGRCLRSGHPSQDRSGVPLCHTCAAKRRRTRFRYDDAGAIVEVQCATCHTWVAADVFPRGSHTAGFHAQCRLCNNAAKRAWREANRERDNATNAARRRQRRAAA